MQLVPPPDEELDVGVGVGTGDDPGAHAPVQSGSGHLLLQSKLPAVLTPAAAALDTAPKQLSRHPLLEFIHDEQESGGRDVSAEPGAGAGTGVGSRVGAGAGVDGHTVDSVPGHSPQVQEFPPS